MKQIISGAREYMLMKNVKFVHVPHFDELAPENVLSRLGFG